MPINNTGHCAFVAVNFDPGLCCGASNTMYELLLYLKGRGHRVSLVDFLRPEAYSGAVACVRSLPGCSILEADGSRCRADFRGISLCLENTGVRDGSTRDMGGYLRTAGIDYAFTCDFAAFLIVSMTGIPGAHYFHGPGQIREFAEERKRAYAGLLKARQVLVCSAFLQRVLGEMLGIESTVWYPVVDASRIKAHCAGDGLRTAGFYSGDILFKGYGIVQTVARAMPRMFFRVVGRHGGEPPVPGNLAFLGQVNDMLPFYREIDLLLVPSFCSEAYSRTAAEAAVNGIPVIATRVGGLPEALGEAGIYVDIPDAGPFDADRVAGECVARIAELRDDAALYARCRENALRRGGELLRRQERNCREVCETLGL